MIRSAWQRLCSRLARQRERVGGPIGDTSGSLRRRLLIVTRAIPAHPGSGGMESVAWTLALSLSESYDVTVLTTTVPDPAHLEHETIEVRSIPKTRPGRYSLRWWIETARFNRSDFDLVLSVSAGATSMILFNRRTKFVVQAHGTAYTELRSVLQGRGDLWPLKGARLVWWVVMDAVIYARATAVVTIGPAVTAAITSGPYRWSWGRAQPHQILNGVPEARLVGSPERNLNAIVFAGRLTRQKGVDRLITGIANTHLTLDVIGEGPERAALEQQARSIQGSDRVRFHGHLDADAVRRVFRNSGAFAFVPRNIGREGLPVSVLEALAEGLPVLTLDGALWPPDLRSVLRFTPHSLVALDEHLIGATTADRTVLPHRYTSSGMSDQYLQLLKVVDTH